MRKLTRTAVVAVAALTALALAAVATAAYTTPKLTVSYATGNVTRIVASAAVTDDATARAAIVIPNGTTITAAAAGSTVGTVRAQVSALALGGALLPLTGNIIVAPPGAVPAASQAACIGTVVPQVTLLLVLQAAGQTINLPAYITPTPPGLATLGATQLVFCLAPPDIPPPNGATFGAKFLSADMTLNGVFSPVAQGAWVGTWLPWNPGVGTINGAAQVLSPASIAPGGITLDGPKGARCQAPERPRHAGRRGRRHACGDPRGDEAHRVGHRDRERRLHVRGAEGVQGDVVPREGHRRRVAMRPRSVRSSPRSGSHASTRRSAGSPRRPGPCAFADARRGYGRSPGARSH